MHRTIRVVLGVAAVALMAAGCSSGGSDHSASDATSTSSAAEPAPSAGTAPDPAAKAFAKAANAVCTEGKEALSKVPTSVDVVAKPSTPAQRTAAAAWARATAIRLDAIARDLLHLDASGDELRHRRQIVAVYVAAAARVRDEGTAVLADQDFLADDALFDAGFTRCVAAERS